MATSIHEGRLLTGRAFDANAALDAGFTRDFVLNNLAHLADEHAQVRVAWTPTSTSFDDQAVGFAQTTPITADIWAPVVSFGPFPIALRQNGDTYRIRIRVAAITGDNPAAGVLRVVLCPVEEAALAVQANEDNVYEVTLADDTTNAWRSGSSQGSSAWSNMIYAPAELTAGWVSTVSTLETVGGNAAGVEQCLVSLNVYAKTTDAPDTDTPGIVLTGLYAAEYIGL